MARCPAPLCVAALLSLLLHAAEGITQHKLGFYQPKIKGGGGHETINRIRTLFGHDDIVESEGEVLDEKGATCNKPFPAPEKGSRVCPDRCPFMRFDKDTVCHYVCIDEATCLYAENMPSAVANVETGVCSICPIAGCAQCETTRAKCWECKAGFDLIKGQCLPYSRHKWRLAYLSVLIFIVCIVGYIFSLAWRPVVNGVICEQALLYRSHSKVRHDDEDHKLYDLTTNLCREFIPHGGAGTLLHFRFEHTTLIWAVFVTAVMGLIAWWFAQLPAQNVLTHMPAHDEALTACLSLTDSDAADLERMRVSFVYGTGLVYVASVLLFLYAAVRNRQKYVELDEQNATMDDYAVLVSGMPCDPWGPGDGEREDQQCLEEEYTAFFRASWGPSVLGVSIVWDIAERMDVIDSLIGADVHRLEYNFHQVLPPGTRGAGPSGDVAMADAQDAEAAEEGMQRIVSAGPATRPSPYPRFERLLLGLPYQDDEEPMPAAAPAADKADSRAGTPAATPRSARPSGRASKTEDFLRALSDLQTTGYVWVVFDTEKDRTRALQTPLPAFRGDHTLLVRRRDFDAATVLWDGFGIPMYVRFLTVCWGVVKLALIMVVWALAFYGPYAYYVLSWYRIAGASQGMVGLDGIVQSTMLGLVITAGNQLVYAMCGNIAEKCMFTSRDSRDMLNVVLYTCAVTTNTVFDLWIVTLLAHGYQQDTGMDTEALIRNPSMQHSLFVQLIGYLYPGTILLPFIVEPFVMIFIPYHIFRWLVRSRTDVDRWQAEQCLVCPPFDLMRYGDIVVNMVLCVLIFFLTSVNVWWLFAQLITSLLVIYVWDHYRFLRCAQRTVLATEKMDICGQYLVILPCSLLAGAFAFKMRGEHASTDTRFFALWWEWSIVVAAMVIHAVVHVLLLTFVVPLFVRGPQEETITYKEAASKISCNWFNANPVHCLRSSHFHKHDPPHIYDVPGKGYLHKVHPEIHAYYEAPNFEAEASLWRDALTAFTGIMDKVQLYIHEHSSKSL